MPTNGPNTENNQIKILADYTLTNQTVSLSGTYNYDNFTMVNSTINVGSAGLTINAAVSISIDSTSKIIATGMGYSGSGPGRGTNGNAGWGSGGGGYGGAGGNGGGGYYHGGGTYGTQNGLDIDKGSSGGDQWSSGNFAFAGGSGGGLIYLNSPTIIIRGQLLANGNPGTGDCWARQSVGGSGGGSGGGILIYGDSVDIRNAVISANGGTGGTGGIYADGGGGGGGGRVKIFYKTLQNTGTAITTNGAGGVACNVAGQSGSNGVITYTIPTGSASFTSNPSGARIWIDGTDTGILAPNTVLNLPTGNHTYTLKLTGYQDSTGSFSVSYNTNTTVPQVNLTLLPGNLHITSTPSGTRIYIDNADQGIFTPYTITGLSVGNHNLKLTYPNYYDYTALINILTNQTINYDATLSPITGNIMVYSAPTGAEIWIDNVYTTTTVLTGTLLTGFNPGSHNVKLIMAGYDIWTKTITVTSGVTTSVNASLSPYGCTSTIKYSGDDVNLSATPKDGISPYYLEFRKNGTAIDSSRFGGLSNPITASAENITVTRTYTLNDADISGAVGGTIDFSVYMIDSCPTGGMTCEDHCIITIGCIAPVCNFTVM